MTKNEFELLIEKSVNSDYIGRIHDLSIIENTIKLCLENPDLAKEYLENSLNKNVL